MITLKTTFAAAWTSLKGRWFEAMLPCFIMLLGLAALILLAMMIDNRFQWVIDLGFWVVPSAICWGLSAFYLKISRQRPALLDDLSSGFRLGNLWLSFKTNVLMQLTYLAIFAVIAAVFALMIAAYSYTDHALFDLEAIQTNALAFINNQGFVWLPWLSLMVFLSWMALRLSMVFFLLADQAVTGAIDAIKQSMIITQGHVWALAYLTFVLSLLGLLSMFTLGIGLFWLCPFAATCYAHVYESLKQDRTHTD
jgi:uncharacterized membrane protein